MHAYIEKLYDTYYSQPINIKSTSYKPYFPLFVGDNLFYKIYAVICFIIVKLIQGMSIFTIYKSLRFTYKYSSVTSFLKKNKQFVMENQFKEVDVSESILHYIDNYLIDQIKLNPIFL